MALKFFAGTSRDLLYICTAKFEPTSLQLFNAQRLLNYSGTGIQGELRFWKWTQKKMPKTKSQHKRNDKQIHCSKRVGRGGWDDSTVSKVVFLHN